MIDDMGNRSCKRDRWAAVEAEDRQIGTRIPLRNRRRASGQKYWIVLQASKASDYDTKTMG